MIKVYHGNFLKTNLFSLLFFKSFYFISLHGTPVSHSNCTILRTCGPAFPPIPGTCSTLTPRQSLDRQIQSHHFSPHLILQDLTLQDLLSNRLLFSCPFSTVLLSASNWLRTIPRAFVIVGTLQNAFFFFFVPNCCSDMGLHITSSQTPSSEIIYPSRLPHESHAFPEQHAQRWGH